MMFKKSPDMKVWTMLVKVTAWMVDDGQGMAPAKEVWTIEGSRCSARCASWLTRGGSTLAL